MIFLKYGNKYRAGIRPYYRREEHSCITGDTRRASTLDKGTFLFPITTVSCLKLFWTLVLVAIRPHFRYWRILVKLFPRFCRFEWFLLQIFPGTWAICCCSRSWGTFQNSICQNSRALFAPQNSDFFHLRQFAFKPTSGSRNRAPPLFCSSKVLCFSSSVEFNLKASGLAENKPKKKGKNY